MDIRRSTKVDLIGHVFGRLTVIGYAPNKVYGSHSRTAWHCVCICGKEAIVATYSLNSGVSQSCGCLRSELIGERKTTHGHAKRGRHSAEMRVYRGMKQRCYDRSQINYKNYGGRGIQICDRWLNSFVAFVEDMGSRPLGKSIDRINNDGDYEPENCRWATRKEQALNKGRANVAT